MLDTVDFNHVQHISFTQSRLTDAVSVILSELLSYEHPPKPEGLFAQGVDFWLSTPSGSPAAGDHLWMGPVRPSTARPGSAMRHTDPRQSG